MKTVAVAMRKGGAGKTTSALNLACAFTLMGKRVLLIDLDDQKNASRVIETKESSGLTIEDLLLKPEVQVCDAAARTEWEGVSLIGASSNLSGAIRELDAEVGSHLVLKEKLASSDYDVCFIDTSPSLNILVVNAFCAADYLFIPLSSKYFSLQGLEQTLEAYAKVKGRLNPGLEIAGLGFVIHDKRSVLSCEIVKRTQTLYGDLVFKSVVGQNIRIEEAQVKRSSILAYDPEDRGACQYRQLADELASRMGM